MNHQNQVSFSKKSNQIQQIRKPKEPAKNLKNVLKDAPSHSKLKFSPKKLGVSAVFEVSYREMGLR